MQTWQQWGSALVFGAVLGAAQAQILVGQTAGFSGVVGPGVQETAAGAKLYIDAVNAKGGIHGQKIELIAMDDKFDPKTAGENARTLIEDRKVDVMFLTRGTPHTEAIIPHLDKHGVALVGPSTGAMVLHQPVRKNVFNVRATYQREAEKAMAHLATLGMARIAVLYADDSFGADGVAGAQKSLTQAQLQPVVLEKFSRAQPDFAPLAAKIAQAQAQAVMVIGSGTTVVDAYSALRKAGSTAQLVTLSNNASSGFIKSLGEHARGVIVSQVYPNERSLSYPLVRDVMELNKTSGQGEVSPAMLEGFAAAKVLVEGLRRAGPKPTRDRIRAGLESIQSLDLGGLQLSYDGGDHTGLDFADLSIISADGKFRR